MITVTFQIEFYLIGLSMKLDWMNICHEVHLVFDRLGIDDRVRVLGIKREPFINENLTLEVGAYEPDLESDSVQIITNLLSQEKTYYGTRISADKGLEIHRSDMSGWELDDEEKDTVMKNRDRAFDYMVDMVQEYELDGLKTLNEKAIEKFAEISATANASERIKLLRAEEATYSLLGNYWLELADAYFETSQYDKCLDCVEEYNKLATGIYRKDFNYVQILPKAIVAAQETYSGDQYVESIDGFADAIVMNTSTDDWSVRYFAAQVYLDLYAKTSDNAYLERAYKIASENVTVLLREQRALNNAYLSDIVEQVAVEPDYRYMTETEKKEAKQEYKDEQKRINEVFVYRRY